MTNIVTIEHEGLPMRLDFSSHSFVKVFIHDEYQGRIKVTEGFKGRCLVFRSVHSAWNRGHTPSDVRIVSRADAEKMLPYVAKAYRKAERDRAAYRANEAAREAMIANLLCSED